MESEWTGPHSDVSVVCSCVCCVVFCTPTVTPCPFPLLVFHMSRPGNLLSFGSIVPAGATLVTDNENYEFFMKLCVIPTRATLAFSAVSQSQFLCCQSQHGNYNV